MQKTKELVNDIVSKQKVKEAEKAPKMLRNAKAQKMAAKVQLMKLKMKSNGTLQLPQEERVYFKVGEMRGRVLTFVFPGRKLT